MKTISNPLPALLLALFLAIFSLMNVNESKAQTVNHNLTVYKSASCGCCVKWIDHIEDNQFKVNAINSTQLNTIKNRYLVPANYQSCHTAVSQDGYVFEGHIPAKYIQQFLQEKPKNQVGLVVPGMPVGSPGMEYQNKFSPYVIMAFDKNGTLTPYAEVNHFEEQFK
jgi:hypothetical protein